MFQSIAKLQLLTDIPHGLIMFTVFIKDLGNDTKHTQRKLTPNWGELLIHRGVGTAIQKHIAKMEKWFNRKLMKDTGKHRVLDLDVALAMVQLTR